MVAWEAVLHILSVIFPSLKLGKPIGLILKLLMDDSNQQWDSSYPRVKIGGEGCGNLWKTLPEEGELSACTKKEAQKKIPEGVSHAHCFLKGGKKRLKVHRKTLLVTYSAQSAGQIFFWFPEGRPRGQPPPPGGGGPTPT